MRSRWAVEVCVVLAVCGVFGGATSASGQSKAPSSPAAQGADHRVTLDLAGVGGGPACGQHVPGMLIVYSEEAPDAGLARSVIFEVAGAAGEDVVEICTKTGQENPANWPPMKLGKGNPWQATPRVPKGQMKKVESHWAYEIVFKLGNGQTCTIDPDICIRTQAGGCQTPILPGPTPTPAPSAKPPGCGS